jgi:hypothetical protein
MEDVAWDIGLSASADHSIRKDSAWTSLTCQRADSLAATRISTRQMRTDFASRSEEEREGGSSLLERYSIQSMQN